ncbi:MAG: ABC transporter ATP-binding protein [Pirellulaceae bacterium]|jgi:ABC-2 type transport system ATP-binding protein|nr:ABC transporter ATP-binding protein [Pirellulaceae bacterium]
MSDDAAVVVIRDLTKVYGEVTALDHLSLALDRGQILGLIGPNGAGKTTAIKILVGLTRPTAGTAHIDGCNCVRQSQRIKRLVGYMPDTFGSYDNMRVWEYLDFFGAAFRIRGSVRAARIEEVMALTGATYMRDRFVETLSHGMKQRIGIARTLLHDPAVLILDEPANGLDPEARIEIRQILLHLASLGKTLIVTSHILPELSRICDRVAILSRGRLQAVGTLAEIMRSFCEQRRIEVQLGERDEVERATEIVRAQIEPAAEIEPSSAEAVVRFRTSRTEKELAGLLAALVAARVEVTQFREIPSDLEDAFLSFTRPGNSLVEASPHVSAAGNDPPRGATS